MIELFPSIFNDKDKSNNKTCNQLTIVYEKIPIMFVNHYDCTLHIPSHLVSVEDFIRIPYGTTLEEHELRGMMNIFLNSDYYSENIIKQVFFVLSNTNSYI